MRRYRYSTAADSDLDDITEYYSSRNPGAGAAFFTDLESRCRITASFPKTGRPRDAIGPGIRSFVVRSHVVYFRAEEDGIVILRILHGSREVTQAMFPADD